MKHYTIATYMAWENTERVFNTQAKHYKTDTVTAIALCDSNGYFEVAINCLRDGDMGEKDENGVYERKWSGDYIDCYGDERNTLRPATQQEIDLYLQYCAEPCSDTYHCVVGILHDTGGTHVVYVQRGWLMRHLLSAWQWIYWKLK